MADSNLALMYSATNADYKPFDTSNGTSLSGELGFDNGLFLSVYYNDTNFLASGPYVGRTPVESWLEAGIGYAFKDEWGNFYSLISIENVKTTNNTIEGYGAHFGYSKNFSNDWTTVIQLGRINAEIYDWQLVAKLHYQITENFGLTLGLRDYDKWDYTNYEAGIIFRF